MGGGYIVIGVEEKDGVPVLPVKGIEQIRIVASSEEEKELFYVSTDIPFDDRPNLCADAGDLDIGLMRQHLKENGSDLYGHSVHMSSLEIADNMRLLSGPPENIKPLNVGILMFTERPEKLKRSLMAEV